MGGPEVLSVEDVPVSAPGPGQVAVRVEALGLNRAEALFRSGTYYYQPTLPASRLGYEAPESSRPSARASPNSPSATR